MSATALHYTMTHEWIKKMEGHDNVYLIGITHHAQEQLSDVVYVELPQIGTSVTPSNPMLSIDSVKAASDIYSPIRGEIIEVNTALSADPALVNTSPEENGWLVKVRSEAPDLSSLLSADAYHKEISRETN